MSDPATFTAIRFGYGLPLPAGAPVGAEAMLAALEGPDRAAEKWPGLNLKGALALEKAVVDARPAFRAGDLPPPAFRALMEAARLGARDALQTALVQALGGADGFRERLVRFWADHFTAVARRPEQAGLVLAMVEGAIRPHLTGRFADLLRAAALHPAMLLYLDQAQSIGPGSLRGQRSGRGLNENLARELIELHTLGVGAAYAQTDIRQMAELLTGLGFARGEGQVFRPNWAEPGAETVLGKTYSGEGLAPIHAALEDLALRPETGLHLARKLAVHFIADAPPEALVAAMAEAYAQSGGDLMALYAALLTHPAAWAAPLGKVKQPFDFLISALRALDFSAEALAGLAPDLLARHLFVPMRAMGQHMHRAPGPDGWPEEAEAWITPQGLAQRIRWGMEAPSALLPALPAPEALRLRAFGALAEDPALKAAAGRAESQREAIGLLLASATFNRR